MNLQTLTEILNREVSEVIWYVKNDEYIACLDNTFIMFEPHFSIKDEKIVLSYGYYDPIHVFEADVKIEELKKTFGHFMLTMLQDTLITLQNTKSQYRALVNFVEKNNY